MSVASGWRFSPLGAPSWLQQNLSHPRSQIPTAFCYSKWACVPSRSANNTEHCLSQPRPWQSSIFIGPNPHSWSSQGWQHPSLPLGKEHFSLKASCLYFSIFKEILHAKLLSTCFYLPEVPWRSHPIASNASKIQTRMRGASLKRRLKLTIQFPREKVDHHFLFSERHWSILQKICFSHLAIMGFSAGIINCPPPWPVINKGLDLLINGPLSWM